VGNLYTFKVSVEENFISVNPFLEKSNRAYLTDLEKELFNLNRYIIIKKPEKYYLNLQKKEVYVKDRKVNKNDIKIEINNWVTIKIGNDLENTLQLGENFIDENYKVYFQKL